MRAGFVLLVIAALAHGAAAHPLDLGYLRVTQTGDTVAVTLDLDVNAAAILLGVPTVDAAAASAGAAALASSTYAVAPITTPAGPCRWGPATATLATRTVTIVGAATCPGPGERRWAFPFVHDHKISAKFELLLKELVGGSERLTLVDASKSEVVLATLAPPVPPRGSRALVIGVAIAIIVLGAFCAILWRWRRRTTLTT
jgi:hypothetical protein